MTRQRRLGSARGTLWAEKYEGRNIVAGYATWFAVDPLCALIELRLLGVKTDPGREYQIKASIEARAAARNRRKELRAEVQADELHPTSDDNFAYIAGYTSGGAPYGVTLEELEEEPPWLADMDEGIEQTAPPEAAEGSICQAAGDVLMALNRRKS